MLRSPIRPLASAMLLLVLAALPAHAQTDAERCLTMRLVVLGETMANSLACEAWSVATRTAPSAACVAYGEQALAERLRGSACASDDEIAELVANAREATAALVGAQRSDSRIAEYRNARWRTEVIVDSGRVYAPDLEWPDQSCRAAGRCPGLMILVCQSKRTSDGLESWCDALPESSDPLLSVPWLATRSTGLPTGQILLVGETNGLDYEAVITLSPDGSSFTGAGRLATLPIFLAGQRVEEP